MIVLIDGFFISVGVFMISCLDLSKHLYDGFESLIVDAGVCHTERLKRHDDNIWTNAVLLLVVEVVDVNHSL